MRVIAGVSLDRPVVASAASSAAGKRYHIHTFGCQMNLADSERMAGVLEDSGYICAADASDADVIVYNTCSIREKAETKVYSALGRQVSRPSKSSHPLQGSRASSLGIKSCESLSAFTVRTESNKDCLVHAKQSSIHLLAASTSLQITPVQDTRFTWLDALLGKEEAGRHCRRDMKAVGGAQAHEAMRREFGLCPACYQLPGKPA